MGQQETFSYDANGRQDRHVDFEGRTTDFVYDQLGRLDLKEFFAAGNDPDGTPDETVDYVYDKLGRQTDLTDARGPSSWDYDAVGRVTKVQSPEGIVNYVYDPVTGRRSHTWTGSDPLAPLSKTEYLYDVLGRLETVRLLTREGQAVSPPEETVYHYDILGNLVRTDLPNGVISVNQYDELGRLVELTHFGPEDGSGDPNSYEDNDVLGLFEYELFSDGRRAGVDETDDLGRVTQIDWFYDNLGRLTGEAYDSHDDDLDFISEYRFDLVGNRLQKLTDDSPTVAELDAYLTDRTFTPDETIGYDYDANDRLLEEELDTGADGTIDKTTVYEYGGPTNPHTEQTKKTVWQGTDTDPATGTKDSETTFGYNLQGRLASSTVDKTGSGGSVTNTSYTYNDSGIRTSQTVDAQTTEYVIDSNNLTGYAQVLEEHVAGQITRSYTIGHDLISQADDPATVYHFLYDGHGSTRALLDAAGAIVADQVFNYDAYGNAVGFNAATALTTILYCGEQFDIATDQLYLRTRYYDAAMGRLNRDDDFTGDPGAPQSLHKYVYAHADPINGIDPSGYLVLPVMTMSSFIGSLGRGLRAGAAFAVREFAKTSIKRLAVISSGTIITSFALYRGLQTGVTDPELLAAIALVERKLKQHRAEIQQYAKNNGRRFLPPLQTIREISEVPFINVVRIDAMLTDPFFFTTVVNKSYLEDEQPSETELARLIAHEYGHVLYRHRSWVQENEDQAEEFASFFQHFLEED